MSCCLPKIQSCSGHVTLLYITEQRSSISGVPWTAQGHHGEFEVTMSARSFPSPPLYVSNFASPVHICVSYSDEEAMKPTEFWHVRGGMSGLNSRFTSNWDNGVFSFHQQALKGMSPWSLLWPDLHYLLEVGITIPVLWPSKLKRRRTSWRWCAWDTNSAQQMVNSTSAQHSIAKNVSWFHFTPSTLLVHSFTPLILSSPEGLINFLTGRTFVGRNRQPFPRASVKLLCTYYGLHGAQPSCINHPWPVLRNKVSRWLIMTNRHNETLKSQ